jgi:hypothetical protein
VEPVDATLGVGRKVATKDVFISADVEADGPIPGPYSMLSFGLCVAATAEGGDFMPADLAQDTLYDELRPISDAFDPAALSVSGLDRERLVETGTHPEGAMTRAAAWVRDVAAAGRPVLVAYPLAYDWLWLYWYFVRYSETGSPFGHSSCLDIKTMYQQKAGVRWSHATKRHMPKALRPRRRHTHHALDDAMEQAQLFVNVWLWDGPERREARPPSQ